MALFAKGVFRFNCIRLFALAIKVFGAVNFASAQNLPPTDVMITNDIISDINLNRLVGYLRAVDPNKTDDHTFELSGEFADKFEIRDNELWARDIPWLFREGSIISVPITAIDNGGLTFQKNILIKEIDFDDFVLIYTGNQVTDYRIFTMPTTNKVLNNNTVFARYKVAQDSNIGEIWAIYEFIENGEYRLVHFGDELIGGRGYWVIINDRSGRVEYDPGADPVLINERGEFVMHLQSGWNLIGNPFREILNWDDVLSYNIDHGYITDGQVSRVVTYDGAYNVQGSLKIMEGAFVYSSITTDVFLKKSGYSFDIGDQKRLSDSFGEVIETEGWTLQISMLSKGRKTNMCGIGMSSSASNGNDSNDLFIPPSPNEDFGFGWKDSYGLSTNIVAVQDKYVWEYFFSSKGQFELTWDQKIVKSLGEEIWMEFVPQNRFINMLDSDRASFTAVAHQAVRIHYGYQPNMYQVEIFPNPARENMNFRVLSSSDKEVQLKIIDLNGNPVIEYKIFSKKGQTEWDWDLRNINGQRVLSGLYFCEIYSQDQLEGVIKIVVN